MKTIDQLKKEGKNRAREEKEREKNQIWVIRDGKIVERESLVVKPKPSKVKLKKPRKLRASRLAYKEYIVSKAWNRRKNAFYQKHKRQCNACLTKKFIQVHHMIYRKKLFGVEPDQHLIALCRDCHKEFHDLNGVHQNMLKMTLKFVQGKRML